MSSDEEVVVTRKKKLVVDSDSGEELENTSDTKNKIFNVENFDDEQPEKTEKKSVLVSDDNPDIEMPDSEAGNSVLKSIENNKNELEQYEKKKKKSRRLKTLDSSSESDNEVLTKPKRTKTPRGHDKHKSKVSSRESKLNASGSSDENMTKDDGNDDNSTKKSWYKNGDLFDAESSDEEEKLNQSESKKSRPNDSESSDQEDKPNETKNSWYKNKEGLFGEESSGGENSPVKESKHSDDSEGSGSGGDDGRRAASPLQRKERKSKTKANHEMQEIHKESQRLLRESRYSLPCHRPRQRSLAEFLARRKVTPPVTLHNSSDKLQAAWKAIEEREKEVETFYKSESSDEEEPINEEETKDDLNKNTAEKSDQIIEDNIENNTVVSKATENECIDDNNISSIIKTSDSTENDGEEIEKLQELKLDDGNENVDASNQPIKDGIDEPDELPNTEDTVICTNETIELTNREEPMQIGWEKHKHGSEEIDSSNVNSMQSTSELGSVDYSEITYNGLSFKLMKMPSCSEKDMDKDKPELSKPSDNDDNSLINTEEFSLRLSESQTFSDSSSKKNEEINDDDKVGSHLQTLTKQESFTEKMETEMAKEKSEIHNIEDGNQATEITNVQNNNEMTISKIVEDGKQSLQDSDKNEIEEIANTPINETGYIESTNSKDQNTDLEKNGHNVIEDVSTRSIKEITEVHVELESTKLEDDMEKLNLKYSIDLKKTETIVPKINDFNDQVIEIDLEEKIKKPGVNNLIERFFTHLTYKKKPAKKKTTVDLSIVSAETDAAGHVSGISEEVVRVLVGEEEEEERSGVEAKPGAKYARLRDQLRAEMGRRREQEWTKRQQDHQLYEEEIYEGEKETCKDDEDEDIAEDDDNDNEEEKESDDAEETEEEEEEDEEEDERQAAKENKKKSAFLDDEAEESDDDNCMNEADEDEEASSSSFIKRPSTKKKKVALERTNTADMFYSQVLQPACSEDELPSFQRPRPPGEERPEEREESDTSSVCPSPAFRLTALENKEGHSFNWSEPSTPCKEFTSPLKIETPVRISLAPLVDGSPIVNSQELEVMCSGRFTSQAPAPADEEDEGFELFMGEDSQITQNNETPKKTPPDDPESLDGQRQTRALLLDDEDLDDVLVNRKAKKLIFSDDEDEGNADEPAEEDSGRSEDEVDVEKLEEAEAEDVDYDSEENEVVKNAKDFLEKEAELSEEEWASEDEEEDGLDTLEMEEADKEKIDERKLKRQLEEMHMRQMQIEDKNQVRLLQEMLLEDGELHSDNKRKRLFRWANNAFGEGDNKANIDSDEERAEEDEDEEEWRKKRHEREQFLLKQKSKTDGFELVIEEGEGEDSQVMRLGQQALRRMNSLEPTPPLAQPQHALNLASPTVKGPYKNTLGMQRGSLLSRGERVLSRMAQMASADTLASVKQPSNSRNFVFASVSPTKESEETKPVLAANKRKMPVLPLPMAKKPCVQRPKTANKKSIFEALFSPKVQS